MLGCCVKRSHHGVNSFEHEHVSRVLGKSLRQEFYEALDHHSPRLMENFKAKRGLTGQVLADLMRQTKVS